MKLICPGCQGVYIPLIDGRYECSQCGGKVEQEGILDEERGLKMAELALTNDTRLVVDLPLRSWWLIVCACQLQVAHPGIHEPLKSIVEQIGRKLQAQIVEALPEVEELLEAGWHRENDYIDDEDGWNFDAEAYGNKDIRDDLGIDDDDVDDADGPFDGGAESDLPEVPW